MTLGRLGNAEIDVQLNHRRLQQDTKRVQQQFLRTFRGVGTEAGKELETSVNVPRLNRLFAGLNIPELRLGPLDTSRVESGVQEVRSDLRELDGLASRVDLGRIGGVDDMRRRVSTGISQVERDIRGLDGAVSRVRLGRLDTSGLNRSIDLLKERIGSGGGGAAAPPRRGIGIGARAAAGAAVGLAGGPKGAIVGGRFQVWVWGCFKRHNRQPRRQKNLQRWRTKAVCLFAANIIFRLLQRSQGLRMDWMEWPIVPMN